MIGAFPIPERKSVPLISKLPIPQIPSRHGLHFGVTQCVLGKGYSEPRPNQKMWEGWASGYVSKLDTPFQPMVFQCFSSWSSFFQLSWCNINWLTSIFEAFSLAGSSHHEDCKTGCFRNLTGMVNQKTKLLLFRKQMVLFWTGCIIARKWARFLSPRWLNFHHGNHKSPHKS